MQIVTKKKEENFWLDFRTLAASMCNISVLNLVMVTKVKNE